MKFTITNKRNEKRSVPVQGNYEMLIQPYGTIVLDYPAGAESFFKALKDYDYDVKVESSELDKKIEDHNKKMKAIQKKVIKEETKKQIELKNSVQMPVTVENPFYVDDNDTTVIQSTTIVETTPSVKEDIKKEEPVIEEVKTEEVVEEHIVEEPQVEVKPESTNTEEAKVEEPVQESQNVIAEEQSSTVEETKEIETKDIILTKCSSLSAEQLREICKELGINTTSNNANTLTNKIRNSEASDEEVISAYHKVVDTNE